jgi:hypothetical protein
MTEVRVIEDSIGYHQQRTFEFAFASATPNTISKLSQTIEFVVLAWQAKIKCNPNQRGDFLSVCLNPNTVIGLLAAGATAGQTDITVDASAASYAWPGEYLIFNDVTVEERQIKSVSGTTVTLTQPLVNNHAINCPLGLSVKLVDHTYLDGVTDIVVGGKGIRGQLLQADSELQLELLNTSGRAKTVYATMEYYTGG